MGHGISLTSITPDVFTDNLTRTGRKLRRLLLSAITLMLLLGGIGLPLHAQTFENIAPLFFVKPFAGADPLPQMITVSISGNPGLSVGSSTSTGGSWLSTSPTGGGCCGSPQTVAVIVTTTATMGVGTYTGQVTLTSGSVVQNVSVTLNVVAVTGPYFDNTPGALSFSMATSGTIASQVMQLRSAGTSGGSLNWSMTPSTYNSGSWLTVSATSGTTPSYVTVGINPQNLPGSGLTAGTFIGQLLFQTSGGASETVPISVTVGSNIFDQVSPLYFTKPYTGSSPPSQSITIVSNGTNFGFNVGSYSATGGNWLTVSPTGGGCCGTPESLTITANPAVTTPAGTYTGEVWVTSGHLSMVIPVTITVAALTETFFDNVAGGLNFNMATAPTNAPPSQLVQIRDAGPGTLNWSLTTTTGDNGHWLNATPTSGAAPGLVTVSIVPSSLPNQGLVAGVFEGNLLFIEANSAVTVPITVSVGNTFRQVNGLWFTMLQAGPDPLPQVIQISSTSTNFGFSVGSSTGSGGNWLTVSPTGGGCCGTPESLTVSVTAPVTMPAGTYTGEVFVNSGNIVQMTIPVTLTIAAAGSTYLDNLPGGLTFSMLTSGQPSPQMFQIRSAGPNSLNWTLTPTTTDGGNWLQVSSSSGVAPTEITVSIAPGNLPGAGLTAGQFNGQLLVQSANGSYTIPVTLIVGGTAFSQVNGINFTMPQGGANPLPQVVEAASTAGNFGFSVGSSTATGGDWLSVSPTGGGCCGTVEPIVATVTAPATMPAGIYTGEIVFYGSGTAQTIPVTLTVAPPNEPFFDNVPGQLAYSLQTSGGNPPSQGVLIANKGNGTLNWTATPTTADGGNWLTVSATSGTAPSEVMIGVNVSKLPSAGLVAGVFVGQVLFLSGNTSSVTIPISVAVGGNRFEQTNGITFTMPAGGNNPLPQLLSTASINGNYGYSVFAANGNGGNWLSVSPTGGGCCGTPEVLTATVSAPVGLAAGTYTSEIVVNGGGTATTIPATLYVVSAPSGPLFDNVPGQMSFSGAAGSTPGSQTIQIRNAGGGQLNWTLTPITADGGGWLQVSATSGTAPSTITVSIVPASLPSQGLVAGLFTGELWFQSGVGASSVTVPVSVNLGPSVFVQAPALTFNAPFGTNPLTQTISNTSNGSNFGFSSGYYSGNGGAWLSSTPVGGGCCGTPDTITVKVTNPTTPVPPGTYTGQVVMNKGTAAMTVPVTLTVTGNFTFTLSATSATAPAGGGTGSVGVTASAQNAPWSAASNVSWITITSGASGTGNGTVNYSIAPTSSTNSQQGTLTIAGQTFTVTQAGAVLTLNPTSFNVPASASPQSVGVTSNSSAATWSAVSNNPEFLTITSGANGIGSATVTFTVATNITANSRTGTLTIAGQTVTVSQAAGTPPAGLGFYPVTPCRVVDTRPGQGKTGQFGPPTMQGNTSRDFPVPQANCGVPANALAYSLNVTVVPPAPLLYLSIWPTGSPQPVVSTLNANNGAIVANAAIVPAGTNGSITVYVSNTSDVIIDVNGYFAAPTSTALAFYPVTPCRVADTRAGQGFSGQFGPPSMAGGTSRNFQIPASNCNIPATAQAFALNMTVVPPGPLLYLTTWPTGVTQPVVSTLNAGDGRIAANAAIVPAGTGGDISVFVSNQSDLIIDINGYFAPPGSPGALLFYPVTPCRIADTRSGSGQFGAPQMNGNTSRSFPVLSSSCGLPNTAQAYSLNMTAVPPGPLLYLTTWPTGVAQPVVSTLNALNGQITANAALVPAGANGAISVFVSDATNVIIDVNGYFGQ